MRAVVSRIKLTEPIPDEEFDPGELAEQARAIDGFGSIHLIRLENELVLVIVARDDDTIDRIRDEVGDQWMREHVIPRAAEPPDRHVGDVVMAI